MSANPYIGITIVVEPDDGRAERLAESLRLMLPDYAEVIVVSVQAERAA